MSPRITARLTMYDTVQPTSRISSSMAVKDAPERKNFSSLMALAPSMVGMAMKKLNSAAADRPAPMRMPPKMVEPEREVPGTRLRHWNNPMARAVGRVISWTSFALGTRLRLARSTRINATP